MKTRPLMVIIFPFEGSSTSSKYGGFALRLKKHNGLKNHKILTCALENLAFIVREDKTADVIDVVSGTSMSTADFVYLKSWEALPEEACALTQFLQGRGIPFMDTLPLGVGVSKIATAMRLWNHEIRVPDTLYVRNPKRLLEYIKSSDWRAGERFIAKDIVGAKGKLNFLVDTQGLEKVITDNPDIHFVCQRFIPNNGDYRVGVYAGESAFIIKRVGSGDSHLNNTSAGGRAEYIKPADLPLPLRKLAEDASAAAELQISGVDIIVDRETDIPYLLEVNQGSQIVTGAFTDENIALFNAALDRTTRVRYAKPRQKPLKIIGRRAIARLPELGVERAVAKIDTGAYSSTLHAENIRIEADGIGRQVLVFEVVPANNLQTVDSKVHTVRTSDFFVRNVRSSSGHFQKRYAIHTELIVDRITATIFLTLSDRTEMSYPILLGRRVLRSRFLVNVELSEASEADWKY